MEAHEVCVHGCVMCVRCVCVCVCVCLCVCVCVCAWQFVREVYEVRVCALCVCVAVRGECVYLCETYTGGCVVFICACVCVYISWRTTWPKKRLKHGCLNTLQILHHFLIIGETMISIQCAHVSACSRKLAAQNVIRSNDE